MNQKEQKLYWGNKIAHIGYCKSLLQEYPEFYIELLDLFKNHPDSPDKIKDIQDVSIEYHPKYKSLTLYIHTPTHKDNISWNCCITKKQSFNYLREEIKYQIDEYRRTANPQCMNCGLIGEFHIDHVYPFKYLLLDHQKTNQTWIEYHKQHAVLQVLCIKCNLAKSSKVY